MFLEMFFEMPNLNLLHKKENRFSELLGSKFFYFPTSTRHKSEFNLLQAIKNYKK